MARICVAGGGGFIGDHLVRFLKECGHWVRAVDIKYPRWTKSAADEFAYADLRYWNGCLRATDGMDYVFQLAANMGGAGHVFTGQNDIEIMNDNTLINVNMLAAAKRAGVERYLFSSSACVYPEYLQFRPNAPSLREQDAYPVAPDSEYGWEKLYTERLCGVYDKLTPIDMRIARLHNVYGKMGSWNDGREKLPAAACRKVAMAKHTDNPEVEIWGSGEQTRSFCYIDDCVEMIYRLMESDYPYPMNIGTDRSVSVNEVFDIVADFAKVHIVKKHIPGPLGVQGRNADLSLMRNILKYEPQVSLEKGLGRTYTWVESMVSKGQNNRSHDE